MAENKLLPTLIPPKGTKRSKGLSALPFDSGIERSFYHKIDTPNRLTVFYASMFYVFNIQKIAQNICLILLVNLLNKEIYD